MNQFNFYKNKGNNVFSWNKLLGNEIPNRNGEKTFSTYFNSIILFHAISISEHMSWSSFLFSITFQVRKSKLKWIKYLQIYTFLDLTWLFLYTSSHKSSQVISQKFQVKSSQSHFESSHKSSQVIPQKFQVKSKMTWLAHLWE